MFKETPKEDFDDTLPMVAKDGTFLMVRRILMTRRLKREISCIPISFNPKSNAERKYATIFNNGSNINMVSQSIMDTLKLPIEKQP